MNALTIAYGEARATKRFVPSDALTIYVLSVTKRPVLGFVRNISPLGACIVTTHAIRSGEIVTVNVRYGYDFLFQAGARIVWQQQGSEGRDAFESVQGMRFTQISPFSRRLIERLADDVAKASHSDWPEPPPPAPAIRQDEHDPDPSLGAILATYGRWTTPQIHESPEMTLPIRALLVPEGIRTDGVSKLQAVPNPVAKTDLASPELEDHSPFEILSEAELEELLFLQPDDSIETVRPSNPADALAGNLSQFDFTVILQLLEATRATGVLYLENDSSSVGTSVGEIHFDNGRICDCLSLGDVDGGHLKSVITDSGWFRFLPAQNRGGSRNDGSIVESWQTAATRRRRDF